MIRLTITSSATKTPIGGAWVTLGLKDVQPPQPGVAPVALKRSAAVRSQPDGEVTFPEHTWDEVARIEVCPVPGHWSAMSDLSAEGSIICHQLDVPTDGIGWWHRQLGLGEESLGEGIRVGVIDTGVGPHAALRHCIALGTWTNGRKVVHGADDVDTHGTHVAGIIGARPAAGEGWIGVASGVVLMQAAVKLAGQNMYQDDVANALDAMVDAGADLVNISLGTEEDASPTLTDSIENAWVHGTVCVAAAGNATNRLMWPASHEQVVAVTAFAEGDQVQPGTLADFWLEHAEVNASNPPLAFPVFNCRGPMVNCCAPGVGIVSAIPHETSGAWGDQTGTSMAAPLACGLLAAKLSQDHGYRGLPRDESRSRHVWDLMEMSCRPLEVHGDLQGNGQICLKPW